MEVGVYLRIEFNAEFDFNNFFNLKIKGKVRNCVR